MSISITKFVDRLAAQEARGAKEFSMPMNEAKALHSEITRLLARIEQIAQDSVPDDAAITVEIQAPGFK